jgi:predicted metal-binding protein
MTTHADLDILCSMAKFKGASGAAIMSVNGVITDPRVRLKCMVPLCPNYGRNLMCPPNVMSQDDFAKVLKKFSHAIIVQYPVPLIQPFIASAEGNDIQKLYEKGEYHDLLVKSERGFMALLRDLELEAMRKGDRYATAFGGGACHLCDECVGQGSGAKCRHPFMSRPAMEAMGIDVYETAKNAGLPFEIPPKDKAVWTGMLLVD